MSLILYVSFLAATGVERLYELLLSRRNLEAVRKRGGHLVDEPLYPWIAAMHAAFLLCCALEPWLLERPFPGVAGWIALAAALAAQGLRYWALRTLGDRWNVRIVVVPGEPWIRRGPYRWFPHPNYLAVVVEIAAIPLIHGAILTAITFSIANALVLSRRIPFEEAAGIVVGDGG